MASAAQKLAESSHHDGVHTVMTSLRAERLKANELETPPVPTVEKNVQSGGGVTAERAHAPQSRAKPVPTGIRASMASVASRTTQAMAQAIKPEYEAKPQSYFEVRGMTHVGAKPWEFVSIIIIFQMCGIGSSWSGFLTYGFGSFLIAMILIIVLFWALLVLFHEMLLMLPFSGGMSTFARSAFGPYVGYLVAQCEIWEYVLCAAASITFVAKGVTLTFGTATNLEPLWWIVMCVVYIILQMLGTRILLRVTTVFVFGWLALQIATQLSMLQDANTRYWAIDQLYAMLSLDGNLTVEADNGTYIDLEDLSSYYPPDLLTGLFPVGIRGVFACIPGVICMVLGLEAQPLLAEDCENYVNDAPKSMATSMILTTVYYIIGALCYPSTAPGAYVMSSSTYQNVDNFASVYGLDPTGWQYLLLVWLLGMVPNLFALYAIIYVTGRLIFTLARGGYIPTMIAWTKLPYMKTQFPWVATLVTIYLIIAVSALEFLKSSDGEIVDTLLYMSMLYATLSYAITGMAYIYLRRNLPHLNRHPLYEYIGYPAAFVVITLSIIGFVSLVVIQETYFALGICCLKLFTTLMHMFIFQRKSLVLSPEEIFIQENLKGRVEAVNQDGKLVDIEASAPGKKTALLAEVIEEEEEEEEEEG